MDSQSPPIPPLSDAKALSMYTAGNNEGTYWFQFIPKNHKRQTWINFVKKTCNDFRQIKNRGSVSESEFLAYKTAMDKWLEDF